MASGASNDEIARQLGLAPATVKSHLSRAYRKIGVGNRVQATRHWLQHLAPDTPERAPAAPTAPTHDADHPPDQIDQHLRALASDSPGARVLRKRRRSLRAAQNDPGADT
jgi:IS30 family transposase